MINPIYITIGKVFEQNFLFEVPKYQRYYAWEEEQVDDFIKDIENIYDTLKGGNTIDHFFGGIVCVKKTVPGSNRQQRELIDGQQRITTTQLLINSIIKNYINIHDEQHAAIIENRICNLKSKYVIYRDEINREPIAVHKLVLSKADNLFFQSVIQGTTAAETRDSHKKIRIALGKTNKFVASLLKNKTTTEKLDILQTLESILHNNCTIIFIEADNKDVAYKLFQVLNDRGKGLNAGDLLKSMTLDLLEKNFPLRQKDVEDCWDEILTGESKDNEDFLKTLYASVNGERAGRASLYDDFCALYFSEFINKEHIDLETDAMTLENAVKAIRDEYRIYKKIVDGDWPYPISQPITAWQRKRLYVVVKYLDFDIILPLLLAAFKLSQRDFFTLVFSLEKFMFRYKTICKLPHQKVGAFFSAEAKKIRQDVGGYRVNNFIRSLEEYINAEAADALFIANLESLSYSPKGGNKTLKYLLSTLNEFVTLPVGALYPSTIIDYDNVSVEHIHATNALTQNPLLMVELNKLQNLTLLTIQENETAANKDFAVKKNIYNNSQYEINKELYSYADWDDNNSKDWLAFLQSKAVNIFKVK